MASAMICASFLKSPCQEFWVSLLWLMPAPLPPPPDNAKGFLHALSRALSPSTEAVTIADSEGVILWANAEVERVYRRNKDTIIGKHPLTFCPKEFSRRFSRQIFDAIHQNGDWNGVVMNVDTGGKRFPILLRTVLVTFASISYIISWAKPFPEKAPFKLSGKQAQCFKLLGEGLAIKEVAARLGITVSSVKTHLQRIKEAIAKSQAKAQSETVTRDSLIDIEHLAVRCHEAGWSPMMKMNAPVKI